MSFICVSFVVSGVTFTVFYSATKKMCSKPCELAKVKLKEETVQWMQDARTDRTPGSQVTSRKFFFSEHLKVKQCGMSTGKPRTRTTLANLHPFLSTLESRQYSTQIRLHTCVRWHADVIQQCRTTKWEKTDNRYLQKSNT